MRLSSRSNNVLVAGALWAATCSPRADPAVIYRGPGQPRCSRARRAGSDARVGTQPHRRALDPRTHSPGDQPQSLKRVLDQLLPAALALRGLTQDGYQADWFCYVGSYATEHTAELGRDILAHTLELPGELLLDIYSDQPDE